MCLNKKLEIGDEATCKVHGDIYIYVNLLHKRVPFLSPVVCVGRAVAPLERASLEAHCMTLQQPAWSVCNGRRQGMQYMKYK